MKETGKLLGWSSIVFGMRLTGAFAVLVTQVLLARWMGAEQLGIYVLTFSWLTILSAVVGLGYPMASMRVVGKALHDGRSGLIYGFLHRGRSVTLGVGSLVAALAIVIVMSLNSRLDSVQQQVFIIALAVVPVLAVMRMHERIAQAQGWFLLAMSPNMVLRPVLFLIGVFLLYRLHGSLDAFSAMAFHVLLIITMAAVHFFVFHHRMTASLPVRKREYADAEWRGIALPLLIVALFSQYFADMNVAIVGLLLQPSDLALYNAGYRIALIISFGFLAINAVLMPKVSRFYAAGETETIQRIVRMATLLTSAGALLAIGGLLVAGRDILSWFGDEFVAAYPSMLILAGSQLVLAIVGPVATLLSVTGHQMLCLKTFSWSLLALVLASVILTPLLGIEGAALAVLLTNLLWALWLRSSVREVMGVEPSILSWLRLNPATAT
ncbi:MAG: oligosaccharide flippase family protein [Thiotrichales bacterium]